MATEAKRRANARYDAANTVQIKIKLNIKHDADIISTLEAKENRQRYIKNLIRENISMTEELRKEIYKMEYEGTISHEQGYRLLQLAEEGIDIRIGLAGRVDGIRRCIELSDAVRYGDEKKVKELIDVTIKAAEEEKSQIEKSLKK